MISVKEELTQTEQQKRSDTLAFEIKKESISLINQLPDFIRRRARKPTGFSPWDKSELI